MILCSLLRVFFFFFLSQYSYVLYISVLIVCMYPNNTIHFVKSRKKKEKRKKKSLA